MAGQLYADIGQQLIPELVRRNQERFPQVQLRVCWEGIRREPQATMRETILIVEDDVLVREVLATGLSRSGFDVRCSATAADARMQFQTDQPTVVLSDYLLPDGTAFDLLKWLQENDLRIPLIVMTGHASIDLAVQAVKCGADQFIPKPIDLAYLTTVVRRTIDSRQSQLKDAASKIERARYERNPFLGTSPAVRELRDAATRIRDANSPVLIQGETGTGKGVLARWLYKSGPRSKGPFIDLNCAGLPGELLESELFGYRKGAFTGAINNKIGFLEAANRGTLFLDEIGDMDRKVQPKMLKVVEDKRFYRLGDVTERNVDVQIIAATHHDLKRLADKGEFRMDLYFRISTLRLRIPPLRERREDILVITDQLLSMLSADLNRGKLSMTESARAALQQYSWPGNIRELRNVLERAALLCSNGLIQHTSLEFELGEPVVKLPEQAETGMSIKEAEKRQIIKALEAEGGNVIRAARKLGIPRSSLYAKLRRFNLSSPNGGQPES